MFGVSEEIIDRLSYKVEKLQKENEKLKAVADAAKRVAEAYKDNNGFVSYETLAPALRAIEALDE